jgi:hypothetical protein
MAWWPSNMSNFSNIDLICQLIKFENKQTNRKQALFCCPLIPVQQPQKKKRGQTWKTFPPFTNEIRDVSNCFVPHLLTRNLQPWLTTHTTPKLTLCYRAPPPSPRLCIATMVLKKNLTSQRTTTTRTTSTRPVLVKLAADTKNANPHPDSCH